MMNQIKSTHIVAVVSAFLFFASRGISAAGPASHQKNASCGSTDYNHVNLQWANYKNDRFGASVAYPANLFVIKDPPPGNGDGNVFHTKDASATLIVSGEFPNTTLLNWNFDEMVKARHEDAIEDGWNVTSIARGPDWYVLSATKSKRIQYEKSILVCKKNIENEVVLEFPASSSACYSQIWKRIADSLHMSLPNEECE
jgi:hypothetical protein